MNMYNNLIYLVIIKLILIITPIKFNLERKIPKTSNIEEQASFYPYVTKFRLGEIENNTEFAFNTVFNFTWMLNTTVQNEITIKKLPNFELKGDFSNHTLSNLSNETSLRIFQISKIPFQTFKANASIGITRITEESNLSYFLEYLKQVDSNYNTSSKTISFVHEQENKAYINFNEYDDSIFRKPLGKCSGAGKDIIFWNCKILNFTIYYNYISIDLKEREYAIFALGEEYIYGPFGSGDLILEKYLHKLNNEKCSIQEEDNEKTIYCQVFDYDFLHDFSFVLEDQIRMTAIGKDLFKRYNQTHLKFKIIVSQAMGTYGSSAGIKFWIIGEPVLKNYNLLFESSENGTVTIVLGNELNFKLLIMVLTMGIAILLGYVLVIYIIKRREREKRNDKDEIIQMEVFREENQGKFKIN